MTITSNLSTVASSIAGLTLTGITNKGITAIPASAAMLCPIFFPQPNDYVTNYKVEFKSFGSNGGALIDATYILNYVYLHCELGSGVATYDMYSGLITNLSTILVAIMSNDKVAGAVDLQIRNISSIGPIKDPSDNNYFGVLFSFDVLEHIQ